jgi:hypothetical protein
MKFIKIERSENQMNYRNKAQSLAKAKVKPCDDAGVDFRLSHMGCVQNCFYSVKALDDRMAIIQRAFSCINSFEQQRLV